MTGPRQVDQAALFYEFSIERHVPANHLLRAPADVCGTFRQDIIQGLVSRYAHEPFEVQVAFVVADQSTVRSQLRLVD
jgi:hypothetical protein